MQEKKDEYYGINLWMMLRKDGYVKKQVTTEYNACIDKETI